MTNFVRALRRAWRACKSEFRRARYEQQQRAKKHPGLPQ
jgi:hypothetical protein